MINLLMLLLKHKINLTYSELKNVWETTINLKFPLDCVCLMSKNIKQTQSISSVEIATQTGERIFKSMM